MFGVDLHVVPFRLFLDHSIVEQYIYASSDKFDEFITNKKFKTTRRQLTNTFIINVSVIFKRRINWHAVTSRLERK